jgi:TPR repeat protein
MYYRGEGVRRDYRQAAEWFLRAANQNCVLAQLNLGVLYQRGLGVPLDYAEAYKWFMLAAKGEADSKRVLKELTQIMTKTQLRDGQSRVSDWISHNSNSTLAGQKADAEELNSDISARVP